MAVDSTPRRPQHPLSTELMRSLALVTVHMVDETPATKPELERFHWNGSEVVVCSVGPAGRPDLDGAEVVLVFESPDGTSRTRAVGVATTDRVAGVAPELRAAAVRYLGSAAGHAECDSLPDTTVTQRLFVTISSATRMRPGDR